MKQIKDLTNIKDFFAQNKILLGFSSGFLIILFCWLFLFLFPQLSTIAKARTELRVLKQRVGEIKSRGIDSDILLKKGAVLENQIDLYKNSVLSKEESTSLLGYLSHSAQKSNVRIIGIEPVQGEEKEGDYLPLFIKINLEGKFYQLVSFLFYLENCSKFIDTEKFEIVSSDSGKQKARFVLKSLITTQKIASRQRPTPKISCLKDIPPISENNPFSLKTTKVSPFFQNIRSLGDIHLQGIVYDKEGPLAVINGYVVHEGEQLGEFMLKAIRGEEILLRKGKESFVIRLGGENE
ncbi:MAG: type 4a pilus biogenesis protein PilO [Candidatus Omnitrophica bacterium]|nr:type 4a pilus biogenesis protein PilO [Candidatus Omnitrophota bacterium]